MFLMVISTEPANIKRSGIIVVVSFCWHRPTNFAGLPLDSAPTNSTSENIPGSFLDGIIDALSLSMTFTLTLPNLSTMPFAVFPHSFCC